MHFDLYFLFELSDNLCYRYLGQGMRYEAGICTIVISMNGAFKSCPFCCRLNFDPKLLKTMDYSLWSSAIFGQKCDLY